MLEEGDREPSTASDDDPLLRAVARAPSAPLPEAGDDADPLRVAHFKIDGRLGAGGMGVVYRAHDESLRREVAVKLLPPVSASDPERRQRFLREARVAASLVHPNVAVVYQVGEADGRVYIAMEIVEGKTLRARLAGGALPTATARDFALQIAQGLAVAHAKGIVHRDLKPENVMVTKDGVVKLLDFGLAKSGCAHDSDSELAQADTETQLTREGHVLGSSAYMSPEQALGVSVDARSDVFSFGIVLYEMICGRRPFQGRTIGEMRAAIAREAPLPTERWVDPGLARIVTRCLERRAQDRYADAGEVLRELSGVVTTADAARTAAPQAPKPSRMRWVAWGGALAIALAVAGIGRTAMRGNGAAAPPPTPSAAAVSASDVADADQEIDDGANPSSNPEAQKLYRAALLAELRMSCESGDLLLKRATDADPSFAAALLRLSIVGLSDRLPYLQRAAALEGALSARDKILLSVIEPTLGGGDRVVATALAEKELAKHPKDVWMWQARISLEDDATTGTLPVMDRAAAANPGWMLLLGWKANVLIEQGDLARARETADGCLAKAPRAPECLWARVNVDEEQGACHDAESEARRWLFLQPESQRARDVFTDALASNGADIAAIREAIGTPGATDMDRRDGPYKLPFFTGDFAELGRLAARAEEEIRSDVWETAHFDHANFGIIAHLESGDPKGAARIAKAFLDHGVAWGASSDARISEGFMLDALEAGGGIAHAAASARRAAILAEQLGKKRSPKDALYWAYGRPMTPVEANEELAAFERLGVTLGADLDFFDMAALSDLGERGRPVLEAQARACHLFTATRRTLLAHLALGRLDDAAGNKGSACSHYATVVAHWGHAKPRSVMADEARARAAKLGCGAP
jgi:serine/threonine-protein kinase